MNIFNGASAIDKLAGKKKGAAELAGAALWLALGFASANAALFGSEAPFGAACCAAAGRKNIIPAAAGAVLGYVFSRLQNGNLRCIAAVLVVLTVRLMFEHARDTALLSSLTAAVAAGGAGLIFAAVAGPGSYSAALALAEGVLAGGAAYFMFRTRVIFGEQRSLAALLPADRACITVTAALGAAALTGLSFGRISLGRIAACLVVLAFACFGKEASGAIAGVTTGAAVGLANAGGGWLVGAYGLGGLMAGVFAVFGRVGTAAAFLTVQLMGVFLEGGAYPEFSPFYEALIAAAISLMIPAKLPGALSFLAAGEGAADSATVKTLLLARLGQAAGGLSETAKATKAVARTLAKGREPDLNAVFGQAAERVCRKCPKSAFCWGRHYSETAQAFSALVPALRGGGELAESGWPEEFAARCPRTGELSAAVERAWGETVTARTVDHRVGRVREVVADQFEGLAQMLSDMREDMASVMRVDKKLAAAVRERLNKLALAPESVACWSDDAGRLTIEAELPEYKLERVDGAKLSAELSELCGCELGEPVVKNERGRARIVISDKPSFTAEIGLSQRVADGEKHCGDSAEFFTDERGRAYMVLSDGMGSGNSAALDSAMTVGLLAGMLRAGFRSGAALRLVNSALLVRSGEESIATADAAEIDLFTGQASFFKAGAAPAYVLRGGHVTKVEAMSLPAGILGGVSFEESRLALGAGDIAVLVSDGVTASGEDWVASELRSLAQKSAKEIAEGLASTAAKRRTDGHEDDITVLVIRLHAGV